MPRTRYEDDDDDYDRPRRRRRRDDDEDHDPRRGGGGLPVGLIVGGAVGLGLVVVGGIVLALVMRKPAAAPEVVKGDPPAREVRPAAPVGPNPFAGANNPADPVASPKKVFGTSLPAGTEGVRQITFAGGPEGVVGLVGSVPLSADQLMIVSRVKTGEELGRISIKNGESPNGFAVAPGGRYAAVHLSVPFEGDAVVLHDLPSKQSHRFTPYSKKGNITTPGLVFVAFAGPDRLVTAHETSGFDVWEFPKMTRVCGQPGRPASSTPPVERNGFSMRAKNVALAPDGKTLAIFDGTGFAFHDTATGQRKAKTEAFIKGLSANFWGAAFSADGTKFAASSSYFVPEQVTTVQVWEVATGRRLSSAPVQVGKTGAAMAFWGSDHLLLSQGGLSSADLMAVASGEVVAKVQTDMVNGVQLIAPDTPGDGLWYVYDRSRTISGRQGPVLATLPAPGRLPGRTLTLTPDGGKWE